MENTQRLQVVDALRGFAIVSIMLLHNIEHFDYYYFPETLPQWMKVLDANIWDTLFFLFGGKSYAIFSLLFGLTFFIQDNHQLNKGKDFRGRFAWRLLLLMGFGLINSAFYEGDILTIYAVLGLSLIPVARFHTRTLLIIAGILLLQPYEWYNVAMAWQHPEIQPANPASWAYFGRAGAYIPESSFWNTITGNLTNGKTGVILWSWEEGRVFQTMALFILGLVAGRQSLFVKSARNNSIWLIILLTAVICFVPLFWAKNGLKDWMDSAPVYKPLKQIATSLANFSFMLVLVSVFVLLYQGIATKILHIFEALGKMSLTNYIMQSIVGASIYYGFGLGFYRYTGALYSLLIGISLAVLQGLFSKWWMQSHRQGPLETIWHQLTWLRR